MFAISLLAVVVFNHIIIYFFIFDLFRFFPDNRDSVSVIPNSDSSYCCIRNQASVRGITVSEEDIFVAYSKSDVIRVYNRDTFKMRSVTVPGMRDPWDIAYSNQCLYIGGKETENGPRIHVGFSRRVGLLAS